MVSLFVLGFGMFLSAKLSVIRAGHPFTFGPRHMSRRNKRLYFVGYSAMGLALLLVEFLAMAAAHIERFPSRIHH
jgi:hypothetical protein